MKSVFLVGFMGAGKSTVGQLAARELGMSFVDLDARIEERQGADVAGIFLSKGEEVFRDLESLELERVCTEPPAVVACGGGIVIRDANRRVLNDCGSVVYLRVTAGEALARVGDVSSRPLLAQGGPAAAQTLLAARESLYGAVADITVDTVGRSPEDVAADVVDALARLEEC